MLSSLFSAFSAFRAETANRKMYDEAQERLAILRTGIEARKRILNRAFKCGVHRWKVVPKHVGPSGLPLTPETKVVFF